MLNKFKKTIAFSKYKMYNEKLLKLMNEDERINEN